MRLNGSHAALLALLVAAAAAGHAGASFADAAGFSGRAGVTCTACHTAAPVPTPAAEAVLEGLPDGWEPGRTYALTVAVRGGPQAIPAQPQGGFDLSVGAGRLSVPAGMEGAVRLVGDVEATYFPDGTLMREWRIDWTAPGLAAPPADVPIWLAVLAANGNHVAATNVSDGGERFDAATHLQRTVPPAPAALAAWNALPLLPPQAALSLQGEGWLVEGRHADGNATRLLWRLDGGPWQARDTATTWRLDLGPLSGEHVLHLRSEGLGRASPDAAVAIAGASGLLDSVLPAESPPPGPLALVVFAFLLALVRRQP